MADYRNERIAPVRASLRDLFNLGRSAADTGRRRDIDPVSASLNDLRDMGSARRASGQSDPAVVIAQSSPSGIPVRSGEFSGLGLPNQEPNRAIESLRSETVYEDANGNRIAPQRGGDFMSRNGAFTGPNNDPTTPGMTREYVKAPPLTSFNPDDARYAKRQDDIKAQESAAQIAIKQALADREESEYKRRASTEAEDRRIAAADRARRIEMEDRAEAFKADQQRQQLEQLAESERWKAQWTAEHGGTPYSPQAATQALKHEQRQGVANDHDSKVSEINSDTISFNQDMDMIEQGGVPSDPKTIEILESIAGVPFEKMNLDKTQLDQLRIKFRQQAEAAQANAALRFQSMMEQLKITERRQPGEFDQ